MNLSTSVLVLLLTLTFISKTYLLQKSVIPEIHTAYLHHKKEVRERRNEFELKKLSAQIKKNKSKSKGQKRGPQKTARRQRTDKEMELFEKGQRARRTSKLSTLNLAPFPTSKPLRLAAIQLLLSLYEGTSLFKDSAYLQTLAPLIIDHLQKQEGDSVIKRLNTLRASHPIIYKMLKGTSIYNIEEKIGYPPLTDFITINQHASKPIHFHFASAPLLDALFSKRIRHIFYALERLKKKTFRYPYVDTKEFLAIGSKEKKTELFNEIRPYLIFDTSAK